MSVAGGWVVERISRWPRVHGVARRAAQWRAGSHHVAAIAVLLDGDDVLVAQHPFRGGAWALPGGWVHRLEDPYRAVERELSEEVGVDAVATSVVGCEQQGFPVPLRPSCLTIAFVCHLASAGRRDLRLASGELTAASWIDTSRADALLSRFERDAIAAARELGRAERDCLPRAAGHVRPL